MKVNFIYGNITPNIRLDVEMLKFMFKKLKQKIEIVEVDAMGYKCNDAILNVFFNYANLSFLDNAKGNIIILEHTSFKKEWLEMLPHFDFAFTKTEQSYNVFKTFLSDNKLPCDNLVNVGWRSPDIYINCEKDYDEVLLFCQSDFNYNDIIENWDVKFPNLNIVLDNNIRVKKKNQDNLIYHDSIKSDEFHKLFSMCGVHICLSEYQTYDNLIIQAKMAKSVVVAMKKSNTSELLHEDHSYLLEGGKKKKNPYGLGSKYIYDLDNLLKNIKMIQNSSEERLENMGKDAYKSAALMQNRFDELFKTKMNQLFSKTMTRKFTKYNLKNSELPNISIITPTYNRKQMFRLPTYIYNSANYPKEKMEWIIIDDSSEENRLDDIIPDKAYLEKTNMDINYVKLDNKLTIGAKRNLGCSIAKHDIIVFMDDDDYYHSDSFRTRVGALLNTNKSCVVTTTIGCFEINRYLSSISIPSIIDPYYKRVSIASMCFKKELWESHKFEDSNKCEARNLIENNLDKIKEITWENNMISLIHSYNMENNRINSSNEIKGCKFKLSEKMFDFIITLDKNKDLTKKLQEK